MKIKNAIGLCSILILSLTINSCKKPAGEGGKATLVGKVFALNVHNKTATAIAEDFDPNESVYISYGGTSIYDNNFKTSYDGSYTFKYLREGTYKIFAYSIDPSQSFSVGKNPVLIPVEKTIVINKHNRNKTINVDDLVVYKEADDGGSAQIKGKIFAKYYNKTFTAYIGSAYAANTNIYIQYGDEPQYGNTIKTSYDGSYEFNYMRKGKYTLYVYSRDSTLHSPSGNVVVTKTLEITGKSQQVNLSDFVIFN